MTTSTAVSAADLLGHARAQQEQLQIRRAALERQIAELDAEASRLAAAVSFMEAALRSSALSSGSAKDTSLADRVVDAIQSSGSRRRDLLRVLVPLGFTASAVDSALTRLRERGLIRREGPLVFRVKLPSVPPSSSSAVDPPRPPDAVADGGRVSVDSETSDSGVGDRLSPAPVPAEPLASSGPASADPAAGRRTNRERVLEVVASAGSITRQRLVGHFEPLGLAPSAVDTAVGGLCKLGLLRRGPVGAVSVVSDRDVSSKPVEADAGSG